MKIVAVLSSPILIVDGVYERSTILLENVPKIDGVSHYIGHPDTKNLAEEYFGLEHQKGKFDGLQVGETALCLPLQNANRSEGWTVDTAVKNLETLEFVLITRIPEGAKMSDGHHTFEELYTHRLWLFLALLAAFPKGKAGWSKKHPSGELCFGGGWVIAWIITPKGGQIRYHFRDEGFFPPDREEEVAPSWNGENETITALQSLVQ